MKLIGIVGKKGAGKDTAATALTEQGYGVAKFAGALKAMMRGYFQYIGMKDDAIQVLIEDARVKELPSAYLCDRSPRHAMQTLGTEWGRDLINPELWVQACMLRCAQFKKVVVTDVRFPNEVAAIKAAGGHVIRILRNANSVVDEHPSEKLIETLAVDQEICNDGTITELREKLLTAVKGLK